MWPEESGTLFLRSLAFTQPVGGQLYFLYVLRMIWMFFTHLLEELLACRRWGILELNPCCCPSSPWYKIQRKRTLRQVESCSEVWMSPQRGRAVFAVLAPIAPFQKWGHAQVKDGHPGSWSLLGLLVAVKQLWLEKCLGGGLADAAWVCWGRR